MFRRPDRRLRPLLPKTPLPEEPSSKKSKKSKTVKDKLDKYVCKTCSKEFKRLGRYENHVRVHTGEFPFICSTCEKRFRSPERLNAHKASHTNHRFACGLCSKCFTTLHQLRKHQRLTKLAVSMGEPNDHAPVQCKLCTVKIGSKSEGLQHMRWHRNKKHKQRPYVCSLCKMRFSQLSVLGWHERRQHCPTADPSKDCSKCRKVFKQKADPEQEMPCKLQHIHQIHTYSKTTTVHTCHVCGKKFKSSSSLGKHLATHFDFDLYKCDSCRMEFEDQQSLKEHNCPKTMEACTKPILVVKFLPNSGVKRAIVVQPVGTSDSTYEEVNQPFGSDTVN